jgi:MYXO-CTERM domain-containing protein
VDVGSAGTGGDKSDGCVTGGAGPVAPAWVGLLLALAAILGRRRWAGGGHRGGAD